MVIYGHDDEANRALFNWLRAIGLAFFTPDEHAAGRDVPLANFLAILQAATTYSLTTLLVLCTSWQIGLRKPDVNWTELVPRYGLR
jgi:hypothetical protein